MIVDAMSAIPSIVAGLFIFAALIQASTSIRTGSPAALALSVLMLPTVTRTTEVVLRLVPGGLREASLALGATEWRTTWHVVLPTARSRARRPRSSSASPASSARPRRCILTTLGATSVQRQPVPRPQDALPLYVYQLFRQDSRTACQRAWTGALVLIALVLVLFVIARILGGRGPGHIGRIRRRRLARKGLA